MNKIYIATILLVGLMAMGFVNADSKPLATTLNVVGTCGLSLTSDGSTPMTTVSFGTGVAPTATATTPTFYVTNTGNTPTDVSILGTDMHGTMYDYAHTIPLASIAFWDGANYIAFNNYVTPQLLTSALGSNNYMATSLQLNTNGAANDDYAGTVTFTSSC